MRCKKRFDEHVHISTPGICVQVCKEAEITEIARQSQEMPATDYLTVVQKDMTGDFTTKLPDKK